jgi:hypothetical protein
MRPLRDSDFDEDGKLRRMPKVLADGETMRIPMSMVDSSAGRSRVLDGAMHRPGFRVTNDAAMLDAKRQAYTDYENWLGNAWCDTANPPTGFGERGSIGAREGDECTLDGAPGHLHRDGGRLVCVPDRRSRDAMTDARAAAYADYENWLRDAWRNAR